MAYDICDREKLADVAMNDFKDIYGAYPKTVASWLMDTHTMSYISEKYGVEAFAICRDQINTDAYTLAGGYFNQGYFPSKNNCFTPAQTDANAIKTPMFRLLGPDPIHNYDKDKYLKNNKEELGRVFTLEAALPMMNSTENMEWFFDTYFKNEDLGFSYAQLGQENGFHHAYVAENLKKQIDIGKIVLFIHNLSRQCLLKECGEPFYFENVISYMNKCLEGIKDVEFDENWKILKF